MALGPARTVMYSGYEVPERVLRFIGENIDDVPQLETLLMMSEAPARAWQISEIAARIYIGEKRAAAVLEALRRRGLLSSDEAHLHFRFDPVSADARAIVAEVAGAYQANLSRIATFIHSKPSASIKEFARAFDLKKDR